MLLGPRGKASLIRNRRTDTPSFPSLPFTGPRFWLSMDARSAACQL